MLFLFVFIILIRSKGLTGYILIENTRTWRPADYLTWNGDRAVYAWCKDHDVRRIVFGGTRGTKNYFNTCNAHIDKHVNLMKIVIMHGYTLVFD